MYYHRNTAKFVKRFEQIFFGNIGDEPVRVQAEFFVACDVIRYDQVIYSPVI